MPVLRVDTTMITNPPLADVAASAAAPTRRPAWIPTAAAFATVALCITAGNWQHRRMLEKEALQEAMARAAQLAPVAFPQGVRDWGAWRGGLVVHASGPRYDSPGEANRIGGYTTLDVRVRYAIAPRWSAELSATNLLDRQRETSIGYDAPRRSVLLSLRFEAF